MARQKKQKRASDTKPKGKSKYASKVIRRNKEAARLGLPAGSTWPEIWLNQK